MHVVNLHYSEKIWRHKVEYILESTVNVTKYIIAVTYMCVHKY